jgi:hypothetical protein
VAQVQGPTARAEGLSGVYTWIWHKLPGGVAGKLAGCTVLLLAVTALLFFVVFPYVEPRLPFNDVTVDQ